MSNISTEINIKVNTVGLDEAIKKIDHLIELLTRVEQLSDSLKTIGCNSKLLDTEKVAEIIKDNILSELKSAAQENADLSNGDLNKLKDVAYSHMSDAFPQCNGNKHINCTLTINDFYNN